jgi:hypothetical protein
MPGTVIKSWTPCTQQVDIPEHLHILSLSRTTYACIRTCVQVTHIEMYTYTIASSLQPSCMAQLLHIQPANPQRVGLRRSSGAVQVAAATATSTPHLLLLLLLLILHACCWCCCSRRTAAAAAAAGWGHVAGEGVGFHQVCPRANKGQQGALAQAVGAGLLAFGATHGAGGVGGAGAQGGLLEGVVAHHLAACQDRGVGECGCVGGCVGKGARGGEL